MAPINRKQSKPKAAQPEGSCHKALTDAEGLHPPDLYDWGSLTQELEAIMQTPDDQGTAEVQRSPEVERTPKVRVTRPKKVLVKRLKLKNRRHKIQVGMLKKKLYSVRNLRNNNDSKHPDKTAP